MVERNKSCVLFCIYIKYNLRRNQIREKVKIITTNLQIPTQKLKITYCDSCCCSQEKNRKNKENVALDTSIILSYT